MEEIEPKYKQPFSGNVCGCLGLGPLNPKALWFWGVPLPALQVLLVELFPLPPRTLGLRSFGPCFLQDLPLLLLFPVPWQNLSWGLDLLSMCYEDRLPES